MGAPTSLQVVSQFQQSDGRVLVAFRWQSDDNPDIKNQFLDVGPLPLMPDGSYISTSVPPHCVTCDLVSKVTYNGSVLLHPGRIYYWRVTNFWHTPPSQFGDFWQWSVTPWPSFMTIGQPDDEGGAGGGAMGLVVPVLIGVAAVVAIVALTQE